MIPGTSKSNSGSSKGKGKGGVPKRPKLATYTLKVVPVDIDTRTTPTAAYRGEHRQQLIIEKSLDDVKTLALLKEHLQVPSHKGLCYMYTRGRALRPATLEDVNATSWNASALHSLMGAGHLYVSIVEAEKPKDIKKEVILVNTKYLHTTI